MEIPRRCWSACTQSTGLVTVQFSSLLSSEVLQHLKKCKFTSPRLLKCFWSFSPAGVL